MYFDLLSDHVVVISENRTYHFQADDHGDMEA